MDKFLAVPFTIESETGLVTTTGIAKFSRAGIVLEFRKKLLGLVSYRDTEISVPITEILDVKFRKGILKFGPTIVLRTKSLTILDGIPKQDDSVILKILRTDFERARDAVSAINAEISEPS